MSSFKFSLVAVLCLSLTLAAVAQTQTASVSPGTIKMKSSDAELVETIDQLEGRVAWLERQLAKKPEQLDRSLVRFGDCTVNLISERANRYLRMSLVLAVAPDQKKVTVEAVNSISPRLKDWLILHLADKSLSDVTGAVKQDQLRDQIQLGMNSVLKAAGFPEVIEGILFDEFNIQ